MDIKQCHIVSLSCPQAILDCHVIPTNSNVHIARFTCSCNENIRYFSPHFLLLAQNEGLEHVEELTQCQYLSFLSTVVRFLSESVV